MEIDEVQLPEKEQRSFFDLLFEIIGWLRIVASPFLVGLLIGFIIYLAFPSTAGILLGGVVALLGLIAGIIWASRIWKKKGTNQFMSRIISMPEFTKKDDE